MKTVLLLACAALAAPAAAQDRPADPPAQTAHGVHGAHGAQPGHSGPAGMDHQMMMGQPAEHGGPAGQANMDAMMSMHHAMMAARSADPAHAWALKMIEHHRGGVAMSRTVLEHSQDAEIRRMAERTIEEQERDIAELQRWIETHD